MPVFAYWVRVTLGIITCEFAAGVFFSAYPLEVKVRALLAERRQRIGYERELVAALTACH